MTDARRSTVNPNDKKFQIRISEKQLEDLERISLEDNLTKAEMIRKLIREEVDRRA